MRLLDGSMEVTSDRTMKIAVKNLCLIRFEVAATYLAVEQAPNLSPSLQVLRSYELPGTAVAKCHEVLLGRLLNAMKGHHEANPNHKNKLFSLREFRLGSRGPAALWEKVVQFQFVGFRLC